MPPAQITLHIWQYWLSYSNILRNVTTKHIIMSTAYVHLDIWKPVQTFLMDRCAVDENF